MYFEDDYDMIFKIVLIGDSGVGKTNILSRYIKNDFNINTKSTVGVEFGSKNLVFENYRIKAQIWDTAGQERYKSITNAYYKGAKGAFIVFDLSKKETFQNCDKWLSELNANTDSDVTVILIGNKCDLEREREVSREEAEAKAGHYSIAYIETSALQALNIDKAFNTMIEGM
jgi:small GTP-binding protein